MFGCYSWIQLEAQRTSDDAFSGGASRDDDDGQRMWWLFVLWVHPINFTAIKAERDISKSRYLSCLDFILVFLHVGVKE